MKNRVITVIAAFMIGSMLTACGSGEPVSAPSVADSDKAAVQEKLNKQDSKTESTTEKSEDISAESKAVSEAASDAALAETESDGKNILAAFFSRADENYNVGTIDVGNTQIVAEALAVGCAVLP